MKKTLSIISAAAILTLTPVLAGTTYAHGEDETSIPAHTHGGPQDDHSQIKALDISPEEAIAVLDTGLADLAEKIEAGAAKDMIAGALSLMSATKTLQSTNPNERQAAALKQLEQQLDNAKHAAEDGELDKAKSAAVRAESALKLYKALQ